MKDYLLDTDICIYFLKNKYNIVKKINEVGKHKCYISEITIAELKFGIENSDRAEIIQQPVEQLISEFAVILIYRSLNIFAKEKARLRRRGQTIDDFDILIGSTAIMNNMIMVTNNIAHFNRLENIVIEDWTNAI